MRHDNANEWDLTHVSVGAVIAALDAPSDAPDVNWAGLLRRLPSNLQQVVREELQAGNGVVSIGCTGWPQSDSVVVCLAGPISKASQKAARERGLRFDNVRGPHSWTHELYASVQGTEHLLIY